MGVVDELVLVIFLKYSNFISGSSILSISLNISFSDFVKTFIVFLHVHKYLLSH
jgi:hypothetical protein